MFNMLKSWNVFNESIVNQSIYDANRIKYKYNEDDYKIVREVRGYKEKIEKEYGFIINLSRFDEMGSPFIDVEEKIENHSNNFFATYDIKKRRFSMWLVKKLEETHNTCVWDSDYTWPELASITPNMTFDNYYLNISGDFFDELERVYYIYYQ